MSNPGPFDKLCEDIKNKLAERNFVSGGILYVNKPVAERFQISHIFNFGEARQTYQFSATYVGPAKNLPSTASATSALNKLDTESANALVGDHAHQPQAAADTIHSPIMFGQIDADGALRAQIINNHTKNLKTTVSFESTAFNFSQFRATADPRAAGAKPVQPTQQISTLSVEYGDATSGDFTACAQIVEPNLLEGSGILIASYLQNVTSNLALGTQYIYQRHGHLQQAQINLGGKYTTAQSISPVTGNPTQSSLHFLLGGNGTLNLSFVRTMNNNISLISDLETNLLSAESKLTLGYKYALTTQNVMGTLNTNGEITTVLENVISPGINFNICGKLDYFKAKSSFGMGFYIGAN